MKMSDAIRNGRLKRRWSQRDLANRSGVEKTQVARIETGDTPDPRFSTVALLCKTLRIPLAKIEPNAIVVPAAPARRTRFHGESS